MNSRTGKFLVPYGSIQAITNGLVDRADCAKVSFSPGGLIAVSTTISRPIREQSLTARDFDLAKTSRLEAELSKKGFAYLPFLDGLRALSIIAVLSFHTNGPIGHYAFKYGGWAGVDVFFVISGFLISSILLQERDKTGSVNMKAFYWRRFLRLMPAFALWLVVTAIYRYVNHTLSCVALGLAAVYMYDWGLAFANVMGSGFDISWSLAVEEKFYLFWPSLVAKCRRALPLISVGGVLLCLIWKSFLIYRGCQLTFCFDTKIDTIMIGCGAALLLNDKSARAWLEKNLQSKFISIAILLCVVGYLRGIGHPCGAHTMIDRLWYWDLRVPAFSLTVAALIVVLTVQPQALAGRFLSWGPIAWLGRISYSIYLWHMLAFAWAIVFGQFIHKTSAVQIEEGKYLWTLVFAAISFYAVEKPFLRMKRKFEFRAPSV
jgi:peptidoglycan/LPS O-acetylase OafA/YrhL